MIYWQTICSQNQDRAARSIDKKPMMQISPLSNQTHRIASGQERHWYKAVQQGDHFSASLTLMPTITSLQESPNHECLVGQGKGFQEN